MPGHVMGSVVDVFKAEVVLTDAEIKALPTTPAVVVPPTEILNYEGVASQLLIPILGVSRVIAHVADYTNVDAGCLFGFDFGSDDSFTYSTRSGSSLNILNSAGGVAFFGPPSLTGPESGSMNLADANNISDSMLDNAIVFFAFNQSAGNFTGGHADNQLKLTVLYVVVGI